jgi:hypothetical protein
MKFHSGRFKPKFPQKYKGDVGKIKYRSSWELHVMNYLDRNPDIIYWNSEEVVIPYISPIDGRRHRYFTDMWVQTVDKSQHIWEIKPHAQSIPPKKRSRVTKKYLNEVKTWGVNQAKWVAATAYCKKRGWKFTVLTEKDLFNGKK